jgi:5,10-methylenetetrahydromethanopterin reductase
MVYNRGIPEPPPTPALRYGCMTLPRSLDETRVIARAADAAGWDWLGIADSPAVYGESYVHQAAALAETTRISVGPLVSHVVIRHPLVVGNLLATLTELGGGRTIGTLATGNSAARGLGMQPAPLGDLREAAQAIRGYWAGDGGSFRDSHIPASGLRRDGCPLIIAADGPRATELAGEIGDGTLYGGTLDSDVLDRRVAAGKRRPDQAFWAAPAISLATTREGVIEDMGAMLVAQANRALRGADLDERAVPASLQPEIQALWRTYDYAYHADNSRPRNTALMSDELAVYLVDHFVLWGDDAAWSARLGELRRRGCDGVMLILGQGDQVEVVRQLTARLERLGELRGRTLAVAGEGA